MRSISMAFLGSAAYSSKGAGSNFSFIEVSHCAHNENVPVNQQVCLKSRPSHLCVRGADLRENGWIPLTFPFNDRPRKYSPGRDKSGGPVCGSPADLSLCMSI